MKVREWKYILKGHVPVPCPDLMEWAVWTETHDRHVGHDQRGGVRVSTIFLGIDHDHAMRGRPILFETMIFGGDYDREQERYSTWDEAEAGHRRWVAKVWPPVEYVH